MKTVIATLTVFLMLFTWAGWIFPQEQVIDRFTVSFSEPGKPGTVELDLHHGGIHITGYEGKEVDIVVKTQFAKVERDDLEDPEEAKGLKRIPVTSGGISVDEEENVIEIEPENDRNTYDFTIKVPRGTSLILSTEKDGDITVENVNGEIEAENHHGAITLTNVSGTVIANTYHEDITVVMKEVRQDRIMSFSSYHGDIDVTLPAAVKANLKVKSNRGEFFTNIPIVDKKSPSVILHQEDGPEGNERRRERGHSVHVEQAFYGSINGGGTEIQFTSYDGNIYLRKGK